MIRRIYVEKRPPHNGEAVALIDDVHHFLEISGAESVRILHRYDVENVDEETYTRALDTVFSDPNVDRLLDAVPKADLVIGVEMLPGQFDQRADSAALCLRLIAPTADVRVACATVYAFTGAFSPEEAERLRQHLINPVEAREARAEVPTSLAWTLTTPKPVPSVEGFINAEDDALEALREDWGLAMDLDDLRFCRDYFRSEKRNPTETEVRMIDTYWSDHCRHTTFQTIIDNVRFEDPLLEEAYQRYLALRQETGDTKPLCLMDIALIGARSLRQRGLLPNEDKSEEINACTVKIDVQVDGQTEPWLLLFKNETHNHPTEIEPFGGASTCIGGAIRDPLAGRAYVYAAMRITGAADPRTPMAETLNGKLPQRKITVDAAQGYASYGNQIGLATGMVHEIYHPAYAAKRMEIGAVVAAVPENQVVRETPAPGDVVVLLGGRTGRDGIGGATGSSKAHTLHSVETAGAEVQKGNAPEERKLQRFFRNPTASRMIKRMNDFGAGGVSVAIGELAAGLQIDLDRVPKKYAGLNGTELAISESQERMAAVIAAENVDAFLAMAAEENLEATPVARVQAEPRLVMRWQGQTIVDVSRAFLDSNGAEKHIAIDAAPAHWDASEHEAPQETSLSELVDAFAHDLKNADQHGLVDRFDATIGAGSVLMPYGGAYHATPIQAMVHLVARLEGHTDTASYMSYAYLPEIAEKSPYHGAYLAVVHSLAKLLATGASRENTYLTFQEYFARPDDVPERWSAPLASLLGALDAQLALGVAAIGGKDSMSGTFEQLDVPPTLVSFAVTSDSAKRVLSPEWKHAHAHLTVLTPREGENGLPETASLDALFDAVALLSQREDVESIVALGAEGLLGALLDAAAGNRIGARLADDVDAALLTRPCVGGFLVASQEPIAAPRDAAYTVRAVGETTEPYTLTQRETVALNEVEAVRRALLEDIFPTTPDEAPAPLTDEALDALALAAEAKRSADRTPIATEKTAPRAPQTAPASPRVVIPVFPGTNCEVDSARYVADAGLMPVIQVIRNQTADDISRSVEAMALAISHAQVLFLPGGFSGGDEPEGSAKLINAFFRNERLHEAVSTLMDRRGGLILGICNGFQALVKLGLLPYGRIVSPEEANVSLTYNTIGRHQSQIVRTRLVSTASPWLAHRHSGDLVDVPISHGEGRIDMPQDLLRELFVHGQVASQYVNREGAPSMDIRDNPNGSMSAIEGLLSPDGRIFGKMGHSERVGQYLYQNLPPVENLHLFDAARDFFSRN